MVFGRTSQTEAEEGGVPVDAADPAGRSFGRRYALQSPNEALQPEAAPPPPPGPPRRRRPTLNAVSGFLSFLAIAAVAVLFGIVWSEQHLREAGPLAADKVLYIPRGDVKDIIDQLEREGVVDSPLSLNVALVVEGLRSQVKSGEYLFKQHTSLREVMDTLVSGKQILHAVTIPEGLTSDQIMQRLRDVDVLVGDIRETPREGTILPETYKVTRGMSRADVVRKMQEDQRRVLDQIWARRAPDLPIRTPFELLTLASIVEKETGKADERPHVASVFINRLQKRMRLQSDPTIVYGLVGSKGTLGRGILRSEVERYTPYNTYAIDGLPPGPIANPGRAALEAVANPSRTQDLYFVADGTGGHVFAETLDQHQRNVQRWRQIERDAKDKGADVDKAPGPLAPNTTRGDLDGGSEGSVFGSLTATAFAPVGAPGARLTMASAPPLAAIGEIAGPAAPPAGGKADRKGAKTRGAPAGGVASAVTALAGAPLSGLGISIPGVDMTGAGGNPLDGPADAVPASDTASDATFPVSAARRADQKVRAAKLGLAAGSDVLPPEGPVAPLPASAAGTRPKIIDVSEGTPLDPLLDHTYDLNHAQSVPSLK